MVKMSAIYSGDKHCELRHAPSNSVIETDAPKDNQGRGEKFSPTDLVAAALASCVLTTMAIMAERDADSGSGGPSLQGVRAEVSKEMSSTLPRKIARLALTVHMPKGLTPEWKKRLEAAAHGCPVHRSLSPEVEAPINFIYLD